MSNEFKLDFSSDYIEGAHPKIIERLVETNMLKTCGYGLDEFSSSAKEKIRDACQSPEADIFFLVGGTQANLTVIDALLRSYQGVISADSGHINTHEAGAIEFGGHKILAIPNHNGKITADEIKHCINNYWQDENREHTVMPGMVYLSNPTEFGTLYTLDELEQISSVCRDNNIPLYLDGARLAYALACPENDVSLKDIARLCDVFYIGGTKCGALFGEAVVIPKHNYIPHFFSVIKQHGALLAKGRIAGIQFETLFSDGLYFEIGHKAIEVADKIRNALQEKRYKFAFDTHANQIFVILNKKQYEEISKKMKMTFWNDFDDNNVVVRITTSWASRVEDVDKLIEIL